MAVRLGVQGWNRGLCESLTERALRCGCLLPLILSLLFRKPLFVLLLLLLLLHVLLLVFVLLLLFLPLFLLL